MRILFSFLFLFLGTLVSIAQNGDCGTTASEQHTTYGFVQSLRTDRPYTSRGVLEEVPLKIHIIGASNGALAIDSAIILSELEKVNEIYAEANIVFTRCDEINYIFDNEYVTFVKNVDETLCDQEDYPNALNVYFAPNVERQDGDEICGYAYNFNIKPRLFVDNGCTSNGSTFAHELGHSFSLLHTHSSSNGEELANGSNCSTAGDLLCDTPADPTLSSTNVDDDCDYVGTILDSQQNAYNPLTENIMSYAPKECRLTFTEEQRLQMEAFYFLEGDFFDCNQFPSSTEHTISKTLEVFPNPSNASIFIKNIPTNAVIQLHHLNGKEIWNQTLQSHQEKMELKIFQTLNTGLYLLRIKSEDNFFSQKLIKL